MILGEEALRGDAQSDIRWMPQEPVVVLSLTVVAEVIMSDQAQIPQPITIGKPLPVASANAFSVIAGTVDIMIALGRTVAIPGPDNVMSAGVEWFESLTISPMSAKQLIIALAQAVASVDAAQAQMQAPGEAPASA
jgi:hypothetical protein